ncbi:hypothetical protein JCM3775_005116 [Rhodotorula graminis]|uniref:Uncharacterized protein n=1 Tax=Rhodotorula graminis (strain WP1) TaxID=578459 RepID=A0A194S0S6_RHOGW|nr:uncharacterized protein RHOBADRAFT_54001 [Rhodotorula graminis WP1]KPV74139.1 hypothetical protein RHOBADRAFT_54001 [Rhodotorula graminis WP1]
MPALDRRQQVWPTTTSSAATSTPDLAQTSATRFVPQATSSADSSSSGSGSDGSVSVWKYAIVVILCVFALGALVRLGLLHRLRRQRTIYSRDQQQHHRARPRPRPRTADSQRSLNNSVYSLDLEHAELPPPGYDEAQPDPNAPAAPVAAATVAPTGPASAPRRGPFARLTSLFRRGNADTAVPMQHLSTARTPASQQRPADPATLAEVAHLRRALRDAGLLGPSSSSSSSGPRSFADLTPSQRAALNGATPAVLVAAAAAMAGPHTGNGDDDVETDSERRRAERVRRRAERRLRRRREREAQREAEEGLGLPTYSRKVADGEATLQRADGWKTDGSDGDDGDDSGDSGDERERGAVDGAALGGAGAVVPTLDGAHPPRASTSSTAAEPSQERVAVVAEDDDLPRAASSSTRSLPSSPPAVPAPAPRAEP